MIEVESTTCDIKITILYKAQVFVDNQFPQFTVIITRYNHPSLARVVHPIFTNLYLQYLKGVHPRRK